MCDIENTPPLASTTDALTDQMWPHLIVLHGSGVGDVHRVTGQQAFVGRDPSADIQIDHPTVSRIHARISVVDGRLLIEDLASTNGTLVGVHAVRGRMAVPEGAVIALGQVTLLKMTHSMHLGRALRRSGQDRRERFSATRVDGREYLSDQLRMECAYAARHGSPLTVVSFRTHRVSTNNEAGTADAAMGTLAINIFETIRAEDVLVRSARDEFVVLLRSDARQAVTMAQRVRARIAESFPGGVDLGSLRTLACTVMQLGEGALAAPNRVMEWVDQRVRAEIIVVRDGVVRLVDFDAPESPGDE